MGINSTPLKASADALYDYFEGFDELFGDAVTVFLPNTRRPPPPPPASIATTTKGAITKATAASPPGPTASTRR
jgi:hypothetical protein